MTWTELAPLESPSERTGHFLAYDSESDQIILFGGVQRLPYTGLSDETWAYDYNTNTWRQMNPVTKPATRLGHAMAYDSESDRVILFGGVLTGQLETWAYDFNANTWTNQNPVTQPPSFFLPRMAYDVESDLIVLFGGHTEDNAIVSNVTDETWTYDYNTNGWTKVNPGQSPSARAGVGMAYDNTSDRVILFGGGNPSDPHLGGTWAYDSNTDTWTRMDPTEEPSGRHEAGMAYDEAIDRVILFGGSRGGDQTWAYDFENDAWSRSDATGPPSRFGAVLAYDVESNQTILFGGTSSSLDSFDDTWSFGIALTSEVPGILLVGGAVGTVGVATGVLIYLVRRRRLRVREGEPPI